MQAATAYTIHRAPSVDLGEPGSTHASLPDLRESTCCRQCEDLEDRALSRPMPRPLPTLDLLTTYPGLDS